MQILSVMLETNEPQTKQKLAAAIQICAATNEQGSQM
jgi:hypothetical protein